MRNDLFSLSLVGLALAGCSSSGTSGPDTDGPRPNPIESAPAIASIAVSAEVLPAHETLAYSGTIRRWLDGAIADVVPIAPLEARIDSIGAQRRIRLDGGAEVRGTTMVDAAGRVAADDAKFPLGLDLLEQLPPAGTEVAVGKGWVNHGPTDAYVRANAAADKMTMTDAVYSTPRALWSVDGQTVMRLDTVARHRISWVDETTDQIRSVEMGLSYLGVTDLVQAPGAGWRVLQFTRLLPAGGEAPANLTIEQLRAADHVEFTACATASSRVDVAPLRRRGSTAVAELASCNL